MTALLAGCGEYEDSRLSGSEDLSEASTEAEGKKLTEARKPVLAELEDAFVGVRCSDGECVELEGSGMHVVRAGESKTWDGDMAFPNMRLQAQMVEEHRATTREALAELDILCDDSTKENLERGVNVTLTLKEKPFDFRRFRGLKGDSQAHHALVEERLAQLRPSQEAARKYLEKQGAIVTGADFLTNTLSIQLSPCRANRLTSTPDFVGLEVVGEDKGNSAFADGWERQTGIGALLVGQWLFTGDEGSNRGNTRVRYGVMEYNNHINKGHPSFRDGPPGSANRIIDTDRCAFWFPSRRCINSATGSGGSHGTWVTSALLGDLMDDQDPAITNSTEQLRRGGVASEAEVHYYSYKNRPHLATALNEAVSENGIDIVNMSVSPVGKGYCHNDKSLNGVRGAVAAATDAGILVVTTAGNDGTMNLSECSINNYGMFPDSLTIGGTEFVDSLSGLDSVDIASPSGKGDVSVSLAGGGNVRSRAVDLVTNYYVTQLAHGGDSYTEDLEGTSFSAPVIAGVAGMVLDWSYERGGLNGLETDPYFIRTLLSLMGDGRAMYNNSYVYTIDQAFGFGNLRFVNFDSGLGSDGGFGGRRVTMQDNGVYDFAVAYHHNTTANGWKWVALIDENFYDGSPDVTFQLIDKCPAGGGYQVLRTAAKHALKARMRVRSSEVSSKFHDRCLYVRATVNHASGPFEVYMADYYYSNSTVYHAAD